MVLHTLHGWLILGVVVGCVVPLHAAEPRAEDPGAETLRKAIELKLNAENLFQQEAVVTECRKALEAGLTGGNKTFCEKMLVATLVQRGSAIGRVALGMGAVNNRLKDLALKDLEEAVKFDPKASEAYLEIGRLKGLPGGDRKAARAALASAIKLERAAGDKADTRTLVEALVLRAGMSEDPKEQLADFNEAVKFSPNNADVLRTRGKLLLQVGKFPQALADFEAALKSDPDNAEGHELRGRALVLVEKYDEAIKSISRSIRLAPSRPQGYLLRGRILLRQGKGQAALDDFNKLIALARPTPDLLLMRARAYQSVGNQARAIKDADTALTMDSGDPDVLLQAGLIYYTAKKIPKAVETYDRAVAKAPKNPRAYTARADAYLQIGEHGKATADYRQALRFEPDDTHVLNNLAWVLATSPIDDVRDGGQAIKLATKACELTKYKQAHILSTLAAGYAEKGDFDTAIKWSKKAVDLGEGAIKENLTKELKSYQAGKPWREKFTAEKL